MKLFDLLIEEMLMMKYPEPELNDFLEENKIRVKKIVNALKKGTLKIPVEDAWGKQHEFSVEYELSDKFEVGHVQAPAHDQIKNKSLYVVFDDIKIYDANFTFRKAYYETAFNYNNFESMFNPPIKRALNYIFSHFKIYVDINKINFVDNLNENNDSSFYNPETANKTQKVIVNSGIKIFKYFLKNGETNGEIKSKVTFGEYEDFPVKYEFVENPIKIRLSPVFDAEGNHSYNPFFYFSYVKLDIDYNFFLGDEPLIGYEEIKASQLDADDSWYDKQIVHSKQQSKLQEEFTFIAAVRDNLRDKFAEHHLGLVIFKFMDKNGKFFHTEFTH